ncbi:hypothetical protein YC2023_121203 [Brassica napus]
MERAMASEYRCVGCGFRVKSLFIQYSPGNIRLMKCVSFTNPLLTLNLGETARKSQTNTLSVNAWWIIFIDLVLHRPKVYRHVLYNEINQETVNIQVNCFDNPALDFIHTLLREYKKDLSQFLLQHLLWKLVFAYLLLDSFLKLLVKDRSLLLRGTNEHSSLVLVTVKVLVDVLSTNLAFLFSFAIAAKGLLHEKKRDSFGDINLKLLQDLSSSDAGMGVSSVSDLHYRYACLNIQLHGS